MTQRRIIYTRRADADLDRLEQFLAVETPGRAELAIARILKGLSLLVLFPELGIPLGSDLRQFFIRHGEGGYIIRYRLNDTQIVITRMWPGKEHREV